MKDRVLVDMAALAGEIMLVSGAEIYRVEDTIIRILRYSGAAETEVVVMATGIFITLASAEGEPLSVVRRVRKRATNMNRVYPGKRCIEKVLQGNAFPGGFWKTAEGDCRGNPIWQKAAHPRLYAHAGRLRHHVRRRLAGGSGSRGLRNGDGSP